MAAVFLMAAVACGDDDGDTDAGTPMVDMGMPVEDMGMTTATLTSIAIAPSPIMLEVGMTQALTVTGTFDDNSMSDQTSNATFMSSADGVAVVSSTGNITAAAVGTATITADVGGVMATVAVTVSPMVDPTAIPMTVDTNFPDRIGFGSNNGGPLHTSEATCPMRAGGMRGNCYTFTFDGGMAGDFTGELWTNGTDFANIMPKTIGAGGTEVTFWAWGMNGGERIEFGAGLGAGADDPMREPFFVRQAVTLTNTPAEYSVRFSGDYTDVGAAFVVVLTNALTASGATIYVDDIQWTKDRTMGMTGPVALPMVVDDSFMGRAGFGQGGPPGHVEDNNCATRPMGAQGACHHITWNGQTPDGMPSGFTGAFWIDGTGFGNVNGVEVMAGATEVSFYAWGAAGGEVVEFGAGLADAMETEIRTDITLTTTPTRYFIRLSDFGDYTEVFAPFLFSMGAAGEIFIDDIQWTVGQAPTGVPLPMVVDDNFPDRSAFSGGDFFMEDNMCPMRAGTMAGNCHRYTWNGVGGFTGTFYTIGSEFMNLQSLLIAPGATAVTFYAWGATGGEVVEFGAGLDDPEPFRVRRTFTLGSTPTKYVVPLGGSYMDVRGPFVVVMASGATEFFVDDIKWENVPIPVDLRPDPEDRVIAFNGGTPVLQDANIGGANVGDAEGGTNYVIPFRLPALPMGGFTAANLRIRVIATAGAGTNPINGDLYGLPFRAAANVMAGDVVQTSMFHADTAVDTAATLLVDNFLTGTTGTGVNVETDAAGDTAIINYLNAQVTAGAVAGDIVYLRLSPDAVPPIGAGYTWTVEAAVDANAPPDRPTLTVQ